VLRESLCQAGRGGTRLDIWGGKVGLVDERSGKPGRSTDKSPVLPASKAAALVDQLKRDKKGDR
jgi:hypothetical protein